MGRGLRLDDVSCTLGSNLRYVLTCKASGEKRVMNRKVSCAELVLFTLS